MTRTIAGPTIQLLEIGAGHGEEIRARSGEQWTALVPIRGGFAWRTGVVTVRKIVDEVVDAANEKTGKEVRFPGTSPVFLVRGWDLPLGSVQTSFSTSREPGAIGTAIFTDPIALKLKGIDYRLRVTYRRDDDHSAKQRSDLVLERGEARQILYSWPDGLRDERCELIWAGDLDGDGGLDLYLYLSDHYNVIEHTLFRSRGAATGKMVMQVARWVTTGC
ncbi:MAG TPA: hypothetical protein VKE70_09440 [Candidatus Solibacter sp.]|nr:hypothetical protein [Candidatus Solibacter sp.]